MGFKGNDEFPLYGRDWYQIQRQEQVWRLRMDGTTTSI